MITEKRKSIEILDYTRNNIYRLSQFCFHVVRRLLRQQTFTCIPNTLSPYSRPRLLLLHDGLPRKMGSGESTVAPAAVTCCLHAWLCYWLRAHTLAHDG